MLLSIPTSLISVATAPITFYLTSELLYVIILCLTFTDEMLRREHKYFFNLLSLETNQEKYAAYWKVEIRKQTFWDGLGVIESFQFEPFGLHKGHEGWAYLL